jgi:16S rRNA (cytosine967-C5)-methyltransferase
MSFSPLALAERIIRAADREHPADAVLRQEFKSQRGLTPGDAARISAAVFAYYRWYGWLAEGCPLFDGIQRALELSAKFAKRPESFSDSELLSRAVPAWVQREAQVTAAWARALQAAPVLWLRARPGQGKALARRLGHCSPFGEGAAADVLRYNGHADLFLTKEFHTGEFELQDISSQAVGIICAPQAGQIWWDACAGEGGKMLHFSDLMENKGLIWASDRAGWRLLKLKRRAARARIFNYRAVEWDGGSRLPTKTKFDGVLVDAPCSGIGTWQRNPHARWTTTSQDVQELSGIQQQLLRNAARAVRSGGRLIYAACTLARAETVGVVETFERASPDFQRADFRNPLSPESGPEPQLFLWPQQFGGNGMFIVVWRRQ